MLLNTFFEVIEQSANKTEKNTTLLAKIKLNKDHSIFQGHFPGMPLVPGVCMTQIIKELLEGELGTPLFFTSGSNIKFLSIINPEKNSNLKVEIIYTVDAGNYLVDAKLYNCETIFFKLRGTFSERL